MVGTTIACSVPDDCHCIRSLKVLRISVGLRFFRASSFLSLISVFPKALLYDVNAALSRDYSMRRQVLIKRVQVTIQALMYSQRAIVSLVIGSSSVMLLDFLAMFHLWFLLGSRTRDKVSSSAPNASIGRTVYDSAF